MQARVQRSYANLPNDLQILLRNRVFGNSNSALPTSWIAALSTIRGEGRGIDPLRETRSVDETDDVFLDLDGAPEKPGRSRKSPRSRSQDWRAARRERTEEEDGFSVKNSKHGNRLFSKSLELSGKGEEPPHFDRETRIGEGLKDFKNKEAGPKSKLGSGLFSGSFEFSAKREDPLQFDRASKIGERLKDLKDKEAGPPNPTSSLFKSLNLGKEEGQDPQNLSSNDSTVEDAEVIFKKMKETGLIPNAVAMLDGLCKDGLISEAMKLFGLMREKGTIPEVVIYTAVVEGFCKAAKFDDAKRIFRKMQKNGIVPNAFSYSTLIQNLCKGKKLDDAVEFFMEMMDASHTPNPATFTGLVDLICKEKGIEDAERMVKRLREMGFAVDDKAVREHMDRKGPFSPAIWEVIFGKKNSQRPF